MKRSKLFLTGMAALLLSFGLMMTGCDSGGGSDDPPPASDQIATIDVTAGDTALVVIATGGTIKNTAKVFIKDDGSAVTITNESTLSGATELGAGIEKKNDRFVITGLTAADSTGGTDKLVEGTGTVTVMLKVDAQQSAATGVAAHTGVPVVIDAQEYTLGSIAEDKIAFTPATTSPPAPAKVNWHVNGGSATGDTPLDPDFDADLIAVLGALAATDIVVFEASNVVDEITFTAAPTAAAKLQTALTAVAAGSTNKSVTLGGSTQTTTIGAGSTVTIPAGVTVTVGAGNILDVAGTLAFTDNTSVLALIGTGGELKATATTAQFHANATTTTGAGLSLTVTAGAVDGAATGWTSTNASGGDSVVLTTATASSNTGTAYVLGNASLAINNVSASNSEAAAVTAVVSTAAGDSNEAEGGIKAGASSAVVITGASA
jgi:hypothetical protein